MATSCVPDVICRAEFSAASPEFVCSRHIAHCNAESCRQWMMVGIKVTDVDHPCCSAESA